MNARRFSRLLLAAGLMVAASAGSAAARQAQATVARKPAPMTVVPLPSAAERVPVDSRITIGRLENGLRYYIRRNPRPANRAELRLVINAGSVLEDDDQLGLAHVVEHMAFNGTKHFQKQEITGFMESIGMQFGPSLNAFTTFDDTTSTCCRCRPTAPRSWRRPSSSWRTGRTTSPSTGARSTRSAASSSRNGGWGAGRLPGSRTSCSRSRSRARATRSAARSAPRRRSTPSRTTGSSSSTGTGTGPT